MMTVMTLCGKKVGAVREKVVGSAAAAAAYTIHLGGSLCVCSHFGLYSLYSVWSVVFVLILFCAV